MTWFLGDWAYVIAVPNCFFSFGYISATAVHRERVSLRVCRVVAERAQRKGVLVHVLGVGQQRLDEVAAAYVMQQVAEELAAERIVAKVLDDAAAVGVAARRQDL